ncbi:MAG TPA: pitrilysin family protein [Flavobacteriaceae bacterium]|nr:pitrilysin family protein [Flavobacteriaceae bacterium]
MRKISFTLLFAIASFIGMQAQHVSYEEYNLANGLRVILHQDNTAPVVVTSVMYHVGAKNETPGRSGFAHFFEHLLFEGTKNIQRGKWFEIVSSNGGSNNANTSDDRTYYYEVFPSNNVELGLWMESERMLHPVINQIGVSTQNEVVKEEKRLRVDNQPYGQLLKAIKENLFKKHPYRWTTIGEMEDLDAATLDEFLEFFKKFYGPNNATLVVAGDIDTAEVKKMIQNYFGPIPSGPEVIQPNIQEDPITSEIRATWYDPNIQVPMLIHAYRTPSMKERDAYVLDMISTLVSQGKSSRLYKNLVDDKKMALQVGAINLSQEDYGSYITIALPMGDTSLADLTAEIDKEMARLKTELISEHEYEKLQNIYRNNFIRANASVEGIAHSLATYSTLYGNTKLINTELDIYKSITREEILEVARKYLNANQRLVLDYLPKNDQ